MNTFGANGISSRWDMVNGSASYRTDLSGNVVSQMGTNYLSWLREDMYGPYRTMVQGDGTASGPFRFSGQWGGYQDVETGLVLMGFRYYDPASGRFLTKDPIGFAGGINQYAYVGSDPVNFVDPSGLLRIGPMDIPNGSIAGGLVTGGVLLAGGPVGWAIGGGFAIGTAWSYFADGNSLSTATAHGAMGAVGGVTAAEMISVAPTVAAGWGLANPAGKGTCGVTTQQGYYPPNNGFAEPPTPITLQPGQILARYGSPRGTFLTDPGISPQSISLPPGNPGWTDGVSLYQVTQPISVMRRPAAPWFGQPGGGPQYLLPAPLNELSPYLARWPWAS